MILLVVQQSAYLSLWPAVPITSARSAHKSSGDNVVRMWVQLKKWCVSCVWVLQIWNSGDGCVLASTLCRYDLRKEHISYSLLGVLLIRVYQIRVVNQ